MQPCWVPPSLCLASLPPHSLAVRLCAVQEIRRIWLGMLSQCDKSLGQRLAAKLQAASAL